MLKSFQGYQPKQAFLSLFTGIVLWLPVFFFDTSKITFFHISQCPAEQIFRFASSLPFIPVLIFSFLFWLFIGYLLIWLNRKYLFLETRTFFPLFLSLTVIPLTGFRFLITTQALTLPFIFLAVDRIFSSYRKNGVDFSFYMAGFWIGIASLIWIHAAYFLIIIFVGLLIFRPFYIREWLVSILGVFTPWYFFGGIYFLVNLNLKGFFIILQNSYYDLPVMVSGNLFLLIPLFYFVVLILMASIRILFAYNLLKLKNRKAFQVFFWMACLLVAFLLIYRDSYLYFGPVTMIPFIYLISIFFISGKASFLKRIIFDLLILVILASSIYRIIIS
ncbi:MAG: hypothetical protein GXO83_00975 [Chlorobi bacterium]|nr:hypothetical protein [Chlorobiota bacterium]